jgi:hypothetical protein
LLEELPGSIDPVAPEPSEQLLGSMPDEQAPDD